MKSDALSAQRIDAGETTAPPVTVLMAVFNGAAYLREAVNSVLSQTFRDFEFVIVNDGSTDDSRAILESYGDPRISVVHNDSNIGLTRSLNRGLAHARGAYIARQDADDVSHPERLARQHAYLNAHPEVALVGTQMSYLTLDGRLEESWLWWKARHTAALRFQMLFDNPFVHTSVMFRARTVRDELSGYAEQFTTSQDFELWSRVLTTERAANLPERLVMLRAHPQSVSARYGARSATLVETVFRRNFELVFGEQAHFAGAASLWSQVATRSTVASFDTRAALIAARQAVRDYVTDDIDRTAQGDIKYVYAATMLRLARHAIERRQREAGAVVAEAFRASPGLVVVEYGRAMGRGLRRWLR